MRQIKTGNISGTLQAPSSKSMMQRAVAAATLTNGTSQIFAPSYCDDCEASLNVARSLGAQVKESEDKVVITGGGGPAADGTELNCGESGTSFRIFAAIAGLFTKELILSGSGTLMTRPMDMIEGTLKELGAQISLNNKLLPAHITGPIHGKEITVSGAESSQFISGLLFALPLCAEHSILNIENLKSKPYVAMTLELLAHFKIFPEANAELSQIKISGKQDYQACDYIVEGDWSGAAFPLVAGAIAGNVTVLNLRKNSLQADKAILGALEKAGAKIKFLDDAVTINKDSLKAFAFDATHCPDLFPPLVALAAACEGTSEISGARRLVHKESNRGLALSKEYAKLGINIVLKDDVMLITGGNPHAAEVFSHDDHRIAMSLAVTGLRCASPVRIQNPECINKSYPEFYQALESITV